jgi:hypothetical protein
MSTTLTSLMSAIVAGRLVDQLERAGFALMKRPPVPDTLCFGRRAWRFAEETSRQHSPTHGLEATLALARNASVSRRGLASRRRA